MAQHTAPHASTDTAERPRSAVLAWVVGGVALLAVVIVGLVLFGGGGGDDGDGALPPAATPGLPVDTAPVVDVATLPVSTTYTVVEGAPADTAIDVANDGVVVHPLRETPVHDAPDGVAIARVEPTQFGDAWFPVVAEQGDWVQVLLPSKPNGSTGWLRSADLDRAVTPYRIEVHLGSMRLELFRDGASVGEWTIGIGKQEAPTPTGRTYLLGAFRDAQQSYSPVILPLGAHSPTHDTFGGGPGTVAIHTWPTDDVYGTATSDGCIRVPPDALDQLVSVPLGTLVMIDQG